MRETLKDVLLMGLGALSLTGEKAMELKKELLEKGTCVYQEGSIKNEELKRDIKEKIKDKTNIRVTRASKEDIVEFLKGMDDDEIEELLNSIKHQKEDSYNVEDIFNNENEQESEKNACECEKNCNYENDCDKTNINKNDGCNGINNDC